LAIDPYEALGVGRNASQDDIQKAYRKLAKKHHPDLNPGNKQAEEKFKDIGTAYDILGDPEKRARFDRGEIDATGAERPQRRYYRDYADAQGRSGTGYASEGGFADFGEAGDMGDMFADLFSRRGAGGGRAQFRMRGGDVSYRLEIDFLDAVNGAQKQLQMPDGSEIKVTIPPGTRDGQVRQRLVRRYDVDLVEHEAEAVAHVRHPDDNASARLGVEHHAHRVLAVADPEWVDLHPRGGGRDRRADLEHVRAQHLRGARAEVVGVVLHERGAARQALGGYLERAQQGGGLPVALACEAVALGHQPLHGETGQLAQRAEVLEVGGERLRPGAVQQRPQAQLDPGAVAQRLVPLAAAAQLRHDLVALLVLSATRRSTSASRLACTASARSVTA
jgi:hypothetical protein